ncbi:hypothetical protein BOO86_28245 [Mycobacterium sp. CBMA 234]|uniref:DUF2306 domain-containing protein n=1 Tax=Mycolicibacterium sp. CBMA 234 TaxID=1918495 RepID=UPI0012DEED8A|nr:DUF2306 domain-containing protein [Mycolicibacterium sp. CBMA 234]MUL68390.1 hypothetical protein [Mycolicibacterium sp. CBMA 234]
MDDHNRIAVSRKFFVVTVAVAILYVPLALNYTWPLFAPGMSRWQDVVNTLINGRDYAVGTGSVESVRHSAYATHRMVLAVHTTLAAVALALGLFQFSPRLREQRPAVHRWTGRAYLALMSVSMLTALAFLYLTPAAQHFIGPAFETQLRALAIGTFGSAWYAVYAIRRRDVITHRAWMTYSIALMMTAPLLRVIWIGIQPLIPQHDLLTNIGVGAIVLGVAAPASAVFGFMLTQHPEPDAQVASAPGWTYAATLGLAALGSLVYAGLVLRLPPAIPHTLVIFHVVPAWITIAFAIRGVVRARALGNTVRERQWRWALWGFAAAPTFASLYAQIVPPAFTVADAVLAGGMDGTVIPITVSFALMVHTAARSQRKADDLDQQDVLAVA